MSKVSPQLNDGVFSLLSNRRRRYALHACKQLDSPIDLGDLAEQIAAWEYNKTQQMLSSEERRRVYTSLQQTHLPRLDEAGAVEFERGTIVPTEELDVYLEVVPRNDIPWAEYYLGASMVAGAVTVGAWQGLYPDAIPAFAWPVLIVMVFTVSAAVHAWHTRQNRLGSDGPPPELDA